MEEGRDRTSAGGTGAPGTGPASAEGVPPAAAGAELERTLGLPSALSVGMGTMIGAGIFVFPGLAAGEAGPAAILSFALGGVIALLVALPASELAPPMPEGGAGYSFVPRGLGAGWGALLGLGQWVGLVFASAFYLVGAGTYLAEVARTLGRPLDVPPSWIGVGVALLLTAVSVVGTREAGRLQNGILVLLLAILGAFLVWGGLSVAGVTPAPSGTVGPFFPFGVHPVFTTAATVFTSYLGFAQIAAVAGEVRDPGRTIPRALLGSVIAVGILYVLTLWVGTALLTPERMGELGETAMVEVARVLAGKAGVAVFLTGGLLATVSSANASILSSSRSIFALGRDDLVPEAAGAVNARFRTPHVAILLAGVPIAALTLLGRIDVLAEVASLLHLVLYGLLCVALIALRRRDPPGYRPSFRCPGHPVVPALGAAASFTLILFMEPLSQILGAAVLAAAFLWYRFHAPDVHLKEGA